MQTFNIENQAFYSIFSMENDLCPNWTSNFLKNNHKCSDYRADYLRQMRYLHVDSFFSKKLIRLSCRLLSLKISGLNLAPSQSKVIVLVETMVAMNKQ